MGRTGQNLQEVLALAASQPCVVFFDEFDALAKSRSDSSDIGEVRRLVNVILQQLDRWPAGGLLIAATNHSELLDPAVRRRFDMTVHFALPGHDERVRLLENSISLARTQVGPLETELLALVSEGWSHADIESWVNRTIRRAVVDRAGDDIDVISALLDSAQEAARAAVAGAPLERARLALLASERAHWSRRRIAEWLGVTHPTISNDLKRARASQST